MAATDNESNASIAILGAGSWGATLARLYGLAGKDVVLWTRDSEKAAQISLARKVEEPLAIELPPSVCVSADLDMALGGRAIVLLCCKAQAMREVAARVRQSKVLDFSPELVPAAADGSPSGNNVAKKGKPIFVSAAKGIELGSFKRMSEILSEELPGMPVAALSGPNLAAELLQGLPTASVVAATNESWARFAQEGLTIETLRMYSNTDVVGVELGGALKNIIAIAAGAVDGLRLGTNAKSALLTRGLAEMTRLAVALGARSSTLAGLAGLGDLIATCSSHFSRNWRTGYQLCQGQSREDISSDLQAVAEGVDTTFAVCDLSRKLNIELPIASQIEILLKGEINPRQAILKLMNRPLVSE